MLQFDEVTKMNSCSAVVFFNQKKKTSWAVDVAQGLNLLQFSEVFFFSSSSSALAYPLVWETLKIKQDVKKQKWTNIWNMPSYHWMQLKKK